MARVQEYLLKCRGDEAAVARDWEGLAGPTAEPAATPQGCPTRLKLLAG